MARPAHSPAPAYPAFLVASISDAQSSGAGAGPAASFPASLFHGGSHRHRFLEVEGQRTTVLLPPEAGNKQPTSNPQSGDVQQFQLGKRQAGSLHASPQQFVQAGMQAALETRPGQPLVSFLNHHVLPVLAYIAVAQRHVATQISERMRNLRRRNPFNKGRRMPEPQPGDSCMYSINGPRPPRNAQRLYESARALERALDPVGSATAFMLAAQADPRQAEWLSLAAKQWSDATYLDDTDTATAQHYNRTAVEVATKAMQLAPNAAHSYIARCVSRGRLALLCDNRTKANLAGEACEDAARALELEPHNDYSHHLMGRWHYEMAGLNAIARTLVRLLYGTALMQGSYQSAMEHYRTATQLAPRTLVHRAEYGRTLLKLGKQHDGIAELKECVACDVEDLNSHLTKQEVIKLLDKLIPGGYYVLDQQAKKP